MHDHHTHIGQFNDIYYDYKDVFCALMENGITETTVAYLTPKFSKEKHAIDFYYAVIKKLKEAQDFAEKIGLKTNILHWAEPLLFNAGFSLEQIFSKFKYKGIALHPVLHDWTNIHSEYLTNIFVFAKKNLVSLFIHTGVSECDDPLQFCKWFADFSEVEVHLAHCKDADKIIEIFSKYENIYGDTAFCSYDSYSKICAAGFKDRMFYGSDFPITHFWKIRNAKEKVVNKEILKNDYKNLIKLGIRF